MERDLCRVGDRSNWWGLGGGLTQEERGYWLTEPALRPVRSVNHLKTLFFAAPFSSGHEWTPSSQMLLGHNLTSLLCGWHLGNKGGTNCIFQPCMFAIHWMSDLFYRHPSTALLIFSLPSFEFPVVSLSLPFLSLCPPHGAHKCSSAALIMAWQTTVVGLHRLLSPVHSSSNLTSCLCHQGHLAACRLSERACQAENGRHSPASFSFSTEVACTKCVQTVWRGCRQSNKWHILKQFQSKGQSEQFHKLLSYHHVCTTQLFEERPMTIYMENRGNRQFCSRTGIKSEHES